jgi:hypothetical protein
MWKGLLGVPRKIPCRFREGRSDKRGQLKEITLLSFYAAIDCFASKASMMAVSNRRLIITAHASCQPDSKHPFICRPPGTPTARQMVDSWREGTIGRG